MKQQPDHLFREKLENFQMNAPSNAWSRIEAGLDKSSQKGLWMKIAAGLMLLSVATVLIWNSAVNESNSLANNAIKEKTEIVSEEQPGAIQKSTPSKKVIIPQEEKPAYQNTKSKVKPVSTAQDNTLTSFSPEHVEESETTMPVTEVLIAEVTPQETIEQLVETSTGVYLKYTAEEVNKKYLRKQPADDATSAGKKSSRLQMLMAVAYNITTSDNGLGDLRQMKDEIFALNFLDEKKRQQKKN